MISMHETSSDPPLDALILAELRHEMGGAESPDFQEAVELYLKDAALRLVAMEKAATQQLGEKMAQETHALRGTSGYVGARKIQMLCLQIESLIQGNELGRASQ